MGKPNILSQGNVCSYCGAVIEKLPYRCSYCGGYFCSEHRLPESHGCKGLPSRNWYAYQKEIIRREPPVVSAGTSSSREHVKTISRPSQTPSREYHDEKSYRKAKLFRLPRFVKIPLITLLILLIEFFVSKDLFNYTIYILAFLVAIFFDWKIFSLVSRINVDSDARLFGLRILSAVLFLAGAMLSFFWLALVALYPFFYLTPLYGLSERVRSLSIPQFTALTIFVTTFSLGLMLVGAFLEFKFMRRAGIIVFPR